MGLDPRIVTLQLAPSVGKNLALNKYNGRIWWDWVHTRKSLLVAKGKATFLTLNGKKIRTNIERVVYEPPTQAKAV